MRGESRAPSPERRHRRRSDVTMLIAVLSLVLASGAARLLAVPRAESAVADAAMRGDTNRVRTLLRDGADVNAAQGDGMTALHWSALSGDLETMNVLLYAGATTDPLTRVAGTRHSISPARGDTPPSSRACSKPVPDRIR